MYLLKFWFRHLCRNKIGVIPRGLAPGIVNFKEFFYDFGCVLFSVGIVVIVLFFILKISVFIIDVDTSPLLSKIIEGRSPQTGDIISLIPLILDNLIGYFYLIIGFIGLGVGLGLKLFLKDKIGEYSENTVFR